MKCTIDSKKSHISGVIETLIKYNLKSQNDHEVVETQRPRQPRSTTVRHGYYE